MMALEDTDSALGNESRRKMLRRVLLGCFLIFLILMALLIARFRVENATQTILAKQRDTQQTWLDKSLDAIRVWRNELVEQSRFISASEMFRLFVMDARELDADALSRIADPEALNSDDEAVRSLAEQLTYMQDLLKDFTRRRAWTSARVMRADGTPLVAPDFATPLTAPQTALVRRAGESGKAAFGPLRMTDNGLVMDMADPLFEVLGAEEPQTVAVLLLSVPMDKPLASFLARTGEHEETLLPRIVDQGPDGPVMVLIKGGHVVQEPVTPTLVQELEPKTIPFMRREALDGHGEVYSMGARPTVLDWRFMLETPAAEVDGIIRSRTILNYALFLACAGVLWLFITLIYVRQSNRASEARNRVLMDKNATISRQKALLDSVNASLHAGLVLVDSQGRVQMENPAFTALAGHKDAIAPGTPLVEVLPGKVAVQLLGDMAVVHDCGQSATVEVAMPPLPGAPADADDDGDGTRLFRVTLYPYDADAKSGELATTGCVATFQDITRFRRNAERARQRQLALITALVHAIESVDPNQNGHSDRMARAAELVADELDLDSREKETLGLAARLSQIGKIFVPRELLTKREALTPEEKQEVLRAPEHADRILHDLRFDLPVRETVREMGERMDGSGSPQGLTGEEISRAGRVLAVVNAFVAMTSPRAWRGDKGMDPAEAVRQLSNDLRFDQEVVAALARVAGSAAPGGAAASGEAAQS
ncbi:MULTISPECIES: HD domain-containing phosphohydrolase [unclassified Desulfovibrio]|uniref:HD domain-containing phosphohydrolase n=1 Tax=unclassified Desulfovibrio TaxID=2593640 RepID=UPI0013E99FCF|nr:MULTISPECIES: HD domain-containing phosphohydrolase [unclassified Desulfovibrio]